MIMKKKDFFFKKSTIASYFFVNTIVSWSRVLYRIVCVSLFLSSQLFVSHF